MKIGFIGVGKITSSLVQAYCTASIKGLAIYLSPRNAAKTDALSAQYDQVTKMENNQAVLDAADVVFMALRPDDARLVIKDLVFDKRHLVVSVIPFFRYPELKEATQPARHVCRAIPLPSVVNHNCPIPVLNSNADTESLFSHIGQPLRMSTEDELHSIWTLTGFITPFYDMMNTLSQWATDHGVGKGNANKYVVDMFQSLANAAQVAEPIDLKALAKHAATPKGLNEQAGIEIANKGAHQAYHEAADGIFERIEKNLLDSREKGSV